MNWMFPKAIGAILVALGTLCVSPTGPQDTPDPPTPAPLPVSKSKTATAKAHVRDPGPMATAPAPSSVVSDELSPIAKAVITTWNGEDVPKVWPCGVPISLTAARSVVGDHPQSLKWVIQPAWVDQWSSRTPDGRQLSVATGTKSKTIKVTLYVAKNDTFDMVTVIVTVRPDPNEPGDRDGPEPEPKPGPEPPVPGPAPPPGPTPPPAPAPAPVLSTVGTQVYNLAIRDIPDIPSRKDKVLALAKSHETVAGQISQAVAGVPEYAHLKEPQAIIDTTVKYNRAAVGTDRTAFVPFFTALNNEVLKPLVPTTLSTAGGHIDVWKDIAAGLRAAAGPAP
jgi:hypothetical protein